jgi:carboxyvinyl-carboxyphosphonate phosphorylmutase
MGDMAKTGNTVNEVGTRGRGTRERMRELLRRPGMTTVAPVFDVLSARVVELQGWEACKVSGSVGKYANYGMPDGVAMTNMSDLADLCASISRATDIPLILDADEAGGNALNVFRSVRDLELAGAAAIEIEDNSVPRRFGEAARRHALMLSMNEQVGKLRAAVDARRDADTVIIARTSALAELPADEAAERVHAYSQTGVDGIMIPRLKNGRADLDLLMQATELPLLVLAVQPEIAADAELLNRARLKIAYPETTVFAATVKMLDDAYRHLKEGKDPFALDRAPPELLRQVNRADFMQEWQDKYLRD